MKFLSAQLYCPALFEIELADIAEKDLWVSKFKSLKAKLEDVTRPSEAHSCSKPQMERYRKPPKTQKLVCEIWNTIANNYIKMKKSLQQVCKYEEEVGVLSIFGSTYLCEQVFSSTCIKYKYLSCLTDENLKACVEIKVTSYGSRRSAVTFRNLNRIKR